MATDATPCELCAPREVLLENPLAYVRHDKIRLAADTFSSFQNAMWQTFLT